MFGSFNSLKNAWAQVFPQAPDFTESSIPDLLGKVYIVTGANSGLGKELSGILYSKNAKVYVAARSEAKAQAAIEFIKAAHPHSKGDLVYLQIDLADLSAIKSSVNAFLSQEARLDVLFNNAGVLAPHDAPKTAQGYELNLGTNTIGTFLLTKLLLPTLLNTAKSSPKDSVRVIWVSSIAVNFSEQGGLDMDNLDYHEDKSAVTKYAVSKVGNFLHSVELARRHGASSDGVVSVALNPGNLDTELGRDRSWLETKILRTFVLYLPVFGAYTELFAGLSDPITAEMVRDNNWSHAFKNATVNMAVVVTLLSLGE
ncbi:Short-chain dehydrogenase/reductase [Diaporthe amygdali]|uniref:Short-chain dehydrogenase/reductase n=1 Tax=Phomopsis amygdali TaxID=1214568 RepID=UPI0022FE8C72|nr:Short-chain dehydrogenase/reductase [Diaporthe amygdali]KAJ0121358.1 Short-chain dehydrogenase/reductase [Diaporthe amygdali]